MSRSPVSEIEEPSVPSSLTVYFFGEALRRIWTSKRTSLLAIGMIAISLFIVGIFLLLSRNLSRAVDRWGARSQMTVFLSDHVTPEQIRDLDRFLSGQQSFQRRRFLSRDASARKFKSHFSNLGPVVEQLGGSPFPPSFEIDVGTAEASRPRFASAAAALRNLPGVDDIQFDWQWIAKLRRFVAILNTVGLAAGGILAFAAAFTIANVIRLTMFLYREEIEIMRLVGATERIIRGPFLAEGFLQGAIGGFLAIGLLYFSVMAARNLAGSSMTLIGDVLLFEFLPWKTILALVGGGMIAGLFGSWLSLRERTDDLSV